MRVLIVTCTVLTGFFGFGSLSARAQVSGVHAVSDGNGRTFITWTEMATTEGDAYRIYRHTEAITAATLDSAERIAEVKENGTASAAIREMAEGGEHNWVIWGSTSELSDGIGLYVYSPAQAGDYYYAVTRVEDGSEDSATVSSANAVGPIAESVGDGVPVVQRHYTGASGREQRIYAYWPSTEQSNQSQFAYPFRVVLPDNYTSNKPYPLFVVFGGYSSTYMDGDYTFGDSEATVVVYLESRTPYYQTLSGALTDWYVGYRDNLGSTAPASEGTVRWYGMARTRYVVYEFINGLLGIAIDPNRVFGYGGSQGGAATLFTALYDPELWAGMSILVPVVNFYQECAYNMADLSMTYDEVKTCFDVGYEFLQAHPEIDADDNWSLNTFSVLFGMPEDQLLTQDGLSVWDSLDAAAVLYRLIEEGRELPPLQLETSWNDDVLRWDNDHMAFLEALEASASFYYFSWGDHGHSVEDLPAGNASMTMLSLDHPALGLSRYSNNDDTLPPPYPDYDAAYGSGEWNGWMGADGGIIGHMALDYQSITEHVADGSTYFEAMLYLGATEPAGQSIDVTPLRTTYFKPNPGETIDWQNLSTGGDVLQSGTASASANGRVTIPGVLLFSSGSRLVLRSSTVPGPPIDDELPGSSDGDDGSGEAGETGVDSDDGSDSASDDGSAAGIDDSAVVDDEANDDTGADDSSDELPDETAGEVDSTSETDGESDGNSDTDVHITSGSEESGGGCSLAVWE